MMCLPPSVTHKAGKAPWKRGLHGPYVIVKIEGNKADLRDSKGGERKGVHFDWMVLVDQDVEDLEAAEVGTEEPKEGDTYDRPT